MECRANRHMKTGYSELGRPNGLVTVEYRSGRTIIWQRCARRCGVRWWTEVDPFSGRVIGRAHLDYSEARGYLFSQEAGGDGYVMGKPEIDTIRASLIHTALQKHAKVKASHD
jgi:hypothetical protein